MENNMSNNRTNNRLLFKFVWNFIKSQKLFFFIILFLTTTQAIDATLWPYLLRKVIDLMTLHESGNRADALSLLKPFFFYAVALLLYVEAAFRLLGFCLARFLPKLEADVRMGMFEHIQAHSPKYFNEHFSGSLSNRISDMVSQISLLIQGTAWSILPAFFTCTLSIFFFYRIDPFFALLLASLILLELGVILLFVRSCTKKEEEHSFVRSELLGRIVDSLTNNFTVNLFHKFRYESSYLNKLQQKERLKNFQSKQAVERLRFCLSVIFFFACLSINGLMIYLWQAEKISTGQVVQIFNTTWSIFLFLWYASSSIPPVFQALGIMRQAFSLMLDPQDVLDQPDAVPLKAESGEIVFDNVSFKYGDEPFFENKVVCIKSGERVGLVGYSGAGKTTFVNLILRFFTLHSGKILIDGQDIAKVTLESLRKEVTLIPQDPILFHRSFAQNIAYAKEDATEEEIVEAAKKAHCHEFIVSRATGYQTVVGERGTKLSGGERQRIACARAMLSSAKVLILDEATSALDSVTECYIQQSVEELMKGRTTLVIAHRLSTLAKMDRILVFNKGKIIEEGTHEQLLAAGGHYSKMWQLQAGGFIP